MKNQKVLLVLLLLKGYFKYAINNNNYYRYK